MPAIDNLRDFVLASFKGKLHGGDLTKRIADLPIDSLELVEFIMALEETFEIEIEADEIDPAMTLEQFCQRVVERK